MFRFIWTNCEGLCLALLKLKFCGIISKNTSLFVQQLLKDGGSGKTGLTFVEPASITSSCVGIRLPTHRSKTPHQAGNRAKVRFQKQLLPTPYNTTLSHPREAARSPANCSPSTTMHSNHTQHSSSSSSASHNNGSAQTLRAPPNPKDPRSYPTPSTSTLHTQTTHSPPPDSQGKLRYHSFSSSSEDIHESQPGNQNGWQQIRRTKRKRLLNSYPPTQLRRQKREIAMQCSRTTALIQKRRKNPTHYRAPNLHQYSYTES